MMRKTIVEQILSDMLLDKRFDQDTVVGAHWKIPGESHIIRTVNDTNNPRMVTGIIIKNSKFDKGTIYSIDMALDKIREVVEAQFETAYDELYGNDWWKLSYKTYTQQQAQHLEAYIWGGTVKIKI